MLGVIFSVTLTNLSPTPQIIDLGPPPTDNNYRIIGMEFVNPTTGPLQDAFSFNLSMGTDPENPVNVLNEPPATIQPGQFNISQVWGQGYLPLGSTTSNYMPAAQNEYLKFSGSGVPSLRVDFIGYIEPSSSN